MSRIFKLFIIFLLPIFASAQTLEVEEFNIVPNDLSARTNGKADLNGNPCALLKVQVADKITKVAGSYIGDVIDQGMEKWVYVTDNSKEIELHFANHFPLHIRYIDYNFPTVSRQMTYVVRLRERGGIPVPQKEITTTHEAQLPLEMRLYNLYFSDDDAKCYQLILQNPDNIMAKYFLGRMTYHGEHLKRDEKKGKEILQDCLDVALVQPNDMYAQYCAGELYSYKYIDKFDYKKAFEAYEHSSKLGFAPSTFMLAVCYLYGLGIEKDEKKAFETFGNAAEMGANAAYMWLGYCFEEGIGVDKDFDKAVKHYRLGVKYNDKYSGYELDRLNISPKSPEELEKEMSLELRIANAYYNKTVGNNEVYQLANDNPDNIMAQLMLAILYNAGYYLNKNGEESKKWASKCQALALLNQDDAVSQYCLGMLSMRGLLPKRDRKKEFECFYNAAQKGFAPACYQLGVFNGYDNFEETLKWLQIAADKGLYKAHLELGNFYNKDWFGFQYTGYQDRQRAFGHLYSAKEGGCDVTTQCDPQIMSIEIKMLNSYYNNEKYYYRSTFDYLNYSSVANLISGLFYLNSQSPDLSGDYIKQCKKLINKKTDPISLYCQGKLAWKNDKKKTLDYFTQSAEQGFAPAMYELAANFYDQSVITWPSIIAVVDQDLGKAFNYYRRAADKGVEKALFYVGLCYEYGKGTKRNLPLSLKYQLKEKQLKEDSSKKPGS